MSPGISRTLSGLLLRKKSLLTDVVPCRHIWNWKIGWIVKPLKTYPFGSKEYFKQTATLLAACFICSGLGFAGSLLYYDVHPRDFWNFDKTRKRILLENKEMRETLREQTKEKIIKAELENMEKDFSMSLPVWPPPFVKKEE